MPLSMYSIFAVPAGNLKLKLQRTIKNSEGPSFVPHLTVVGLIDLDEEAVIQKTREFAQAQKRFYVKFQDVSYQEDAYYQCVFLTCVKTEELIEAHETALKIYRKPDDLFTPHVSLVYSDMNEAARRERMTQLQKKFFEGEEGHDDEMLYETGFWVDEIELWQIAPENKQLENWKLIETFQLTKI